MNNQLNKYLMDIGYVPVVVNDENSIYIYRKSANLVNLNRSGEISAVYPDIKAIKIVSDAENRYSSITIRWKDGTHTTAECPDEGNDEVTGFTYAVTKKFIGSIKEVLENESITKRVRGET